MYNTELHEQALSHYRTDPMFQPESAHLSKYPNELIYCFEHHLPFIQFQTWAKLQDLLYQPVAFGDYVYLRNAFPKQDFLSIDPNDYNTVGTLRHSLDTRHERENAPSTFWARLKSLFHRAEPADPTVSIVPPVSFDNPPAGTRISMSDPDYQSAKAHFSKYVDIDYDRLYGHHTDELVFCHQHGASYLAFEKWCALQDLWGDPITFDEAEMLGIDLSNPILIR